MSVARTVLVDRDGTDDLPGAAALIAGLGEREEAP